MNKQQLAQKIWASANQMRSKIEASEYKDFMHNSVTLSHDTLKKYFPKSYTAKQMEKVIIKLLDNWLRSRQRAQER